MGQAQVERVEGEGPSENGAMKRANVRMLFCFFVYIRKHFCIYFTKGKIVNEIGELYVKLLRCFLCIVISSEGWIRDTETNKRSMQMLKNKSFYLNSTVGEEQLK